MSVSKFSTFAIHGNFKTQRLCTDARIYSRTIRKRNHDYFTSTVLNRASKRAVSILLFIGREPKQRNGYRDDVSFYYNNYDYIFFIY